jgi:phosphosulfolactate synthase (CoM biosynthesis protein A)
MSKDAYFEWLKKKAPLGWEVIEKEDGAIEMKRVAKQ